MMNKFGHQLGEYLEFYNISQKEFAFRIGTTQKNLIDIINGKIELTYNMINNISIVSGIPISYIENVETSFKLDKKNKKFFEENNLDIKEYIKRFNYKEASKKYDIVIHDEMDDYNIIRDLMGYLRISDLNQLYEENNSIFYKSKNEKKELLVLWLERCYKLTFDQKVNKYSKENITYLVDFINEQGKRHQFNEGLLVKTFNDNGIFLVIEDDLPGTKVRGAFKVLNDKPAIYITRKYKRIADIYFALLHELAHCKSDFNRAKSGSIVTYDCGNTEDYEKKADAQALNWMVNNAEYDKLQKDINLLESENINKCFAVYRLALNKIIDYKSDLYQLNNPVINNND